MLVLLERVRFRWKVRPKRAIGDTTYGTIENIRALEAAGIRAYVPLPDFDQRTPYFGASNFTYGATDDAYYCPEGHSLRRSRVKYTAEVSSTRRPRRPGASESCTGVGGPGAVG